MLLKTDSSGILNISDINMTKTIIMESHDFSRISYHIIALHFLILKDSLLWKDKYPEAYLELLLHVDRESFVYVCVLVVEVL